MSYIFDTFDHPYKTMCNSAASCPSCPLRTKRTLSFLSLWGICLPPLSLANSLRRQATRHQSTVRWRGQQPTGDSPAFLGLPLCPVPFPADLLALRQSLPDHTEWEWTQSFNTCHWGSSSSLRCLWTLRLAPPRVQAAPGDALTLTTLQRCVSVCFCCFMISVCMLSSVYCHAVCFCDVVLFECLKSEKKEKVAKCEKNMKFRKILNSLYN